VLEFNFYIKDASSAKRYWLYGMFSLCITRDPAVDTSAIFAVLKTIIFYTNTAAVAKMSVLPPCILRASRQILENIYSDSTTKTVLYKLDRTYNIAFSFEHCAPTLDMSARSGAENAATGNPVHTHQVLYQFVNSHRSTMDTSSTSDAMMPSSSKKQRTS